MRCSHQGLDALPQLLPLDTTELLSLVLLRITVLRGVPRSCHWGTKTEGPKAERGGVVLGEGASTPSVPARGSVERCELPSGVRAEPRPTKGFHYFQHSVWRQGGGGGTGVCGLPCRHWGSRPPCPNPLAYPPDSSISSQTLKCFQRISDISQFDLYTHTFIRNRNEPYLPLPSQL